jgi:NADP-dependent alcohol dehydrogenase
MNNFIFYNPTRLLFGKGMINQLTQQIPADKRIMITFGGGSVKTNGVYEQVTQALEDVIIPSFGELRPIPI